MRHDWSFFPETPCCCFAHRRTAEILFTSETEHVVDFPFADGMHPLYDKEALLQASGWSCCPTAEGLRLLCSCARRRCAPEPHQVHRVIRCGSVRVGCGDWFLSECYMIVAQTREVFFLVSWLLKRRIFMWRDTKPKVLPVKRWWNDPCTQSRDFIWKI